MGRKTRHRRSRSMETNLTYFVLLEGETEKWYISLFSKTENLYYKDKRVKITSEIVRNKNLNKIKERLVSATKEAYDRVFWILDCDEIISKNLLASYKNVKNKLKNKNIIIIENKPCFELWILLHFCYTTRSFGNCGEIETEVKRFMPNYSKSVSFYLSSKNPKNNIYQKLKKYQTKAIQNAKKLLKEFKKNSTLSKTEMFVFIKECGL